MALLVAGEIHVSDLIQKQHARLPFVEGKLDFSGEVVEMLEEGGKDFSISGCHIWTHCIDYILGKIGVESASHCYGVCEYYRVLCMSVGGMVGNVRLSMENIKWGTLYGNMGELYASL
jgi:hypothetical protein